MKKRDEFTAPPSRQKRGQDLIAGSFFLFLFLSITALPQSASPANEDRTWRYVTELSASDRMKLDLHPSSLRDPQIPYLPAEQFPFAPPYTAEEMGLRAMEFPHSPLWDGLVLDISSTVTSTGLLHQEVGVVSTLYLPKRGFPGHLYDTQPGQELFRWLSYSVVPPQPQGKPLSLLVGYRTDQTFATPAERLLIRQELPPLRSRLERDYQAANRVGTFADVLGRNAWEFLWRILGADILFHTVRFPTTLQNIRLLDKNGRPFVIPTRDIKLMDHNYPAYTPEGGVPCYVVEAVPKEDWLADSSLSKLVYWLDQRSFFPLRIEQYDGVGKLSLITVRVATHANPQLGARGYAVLIEVMWDLPRDVMTASLHGILPKEWSEEERRLFFQPNQMSSTWFPRALEGSLQLIRPEEFYLRPLLDAEKFPEERRIELPPELTESITAQEREGRLVFREVQVNGVNK